MTDKRSNLNSKTNCPDPCDFSKESIARDALLLKLKKEFFGAADAITRLTDDDLELINAAAQPTPLKKADD